MYFNVFPEKGFLNTHFGLKLIDYHGGNKYRFLFSDGSSTKWMDKDVLFYKQFSQPGDHTITLETTKGSTTHTVTIENSLKYGNGKCLDILFMENEDIIIQKKTTGLIVYYKNLDNKIELNILPDEIFKWNETHCLFIVKSGKEQYPESKFALFDYDAAQMIHEFEGHFVDFHEEERRLIFYQEDKITICYADGKAMEIKGEFQSIDALKKAVLFKFGGHLRQFDIASGQTIHIGEYEFDQLSAAPNLIVLKIGEAYSLWDVVEATWKDSYILGNLEIFEDGTYLTFSKEETNLAISVRQGESGQVHSLREQFENSLSADRKFLVRSSSQGYFRVYNFELPDQSYSNFTYTFKQALVADLILVENPGKKTRLFSLEQKKTIYAGEGTIVTGFTMNGKSVVVIEEEEKVSFYEYRTYLKLLRKYLGAFDTNYQVHLLEDNHLWIRQAYQEYKVYQGITTEVIQLIEIKKFFGTWILDESNQLINEHTLEILKSNYDNYYDINPSLKEGIVKENDGYYLVWVQEPDKGKRKIFDSDLIYSDCDVHPSGKLAVLSHPGMTEFIDLSTYDKIEVPDTSFVRFDHTGNIFLKNLMRKNASPRIFNPDTFEEIRNPNFQLFKFYSPDGRYKSNIGLEIIEVEEVKKNTFRMENGVKKPVVEKRREKWVTITDQSLDRELKTRVYDNTKWFNYLSFSFDNQYFALAGCNTGGILEVFEIKEEGIERVALLRQKNANWRCVFSPDKKYLACYDSNPITYIFSLAHLSQKNLEQTVYKVNNRSIECYSPDSFFMVMSQHRYEAISVGGTGWLPSSKIYINDSQTKREILELGEHTTQVEFANFSADGHKLISRSEDGIVLIRNFDYNHLLQERENQSESKASPIFR